MPYRLSHLRSVSRGMPVSSAARPTVYIRPAYENLGQTLDKTRRRVHAGCTTLDSGPDQDSTSPGSLVGTDTGAPDADRVRRDGRPSRPSRCPDPVRAGKPPMAPPARPPPLAVAGWRRGVRRGGPRRV